MAKRYSGDVEVRVLWHSRNRHYQGTVSSPRARFRGIVQGARAPDPRSSEAYDAAALALIKQASTRSSKIQAALEQTGGRITLRRVFQAPCPVGGRRR